MLEPRIQQHFFESADLLYQVAENLSRPIADAAQMAVGALTAGGKLLTGGSGGGQVLARLMSSALMNRLERDRPPLAAVSLGAEPAGLHYVIEPAAVAGAANDLALPLMALGQPGDVLVLFCLHGHDPAAEAAIAEAHAKDMSVVLFGAGLSAPWHALLAETDVWIAVPHERALRAMELQLLALHALCDAIDVQLMGDADANG
jgi:D-sedoheptulose 7-phosphate isomerase